MSYQSVRLDNPTDYVHQRTRSQGYENMEDVFRTQKLSYHRNMSPVKWQYIFLINLFNYANILYDDDEKILYLGGLMGREDFNAHEQS